MGEREKTNKSGTAGRIDNKSKEIRCYVIKKNRKGSKKIVRNDPAWEFELMNVERI